MALKFSFIVPAYNVRDYIVKCVISMTEQVSRDEHDIEVIVVDDGSPDGLYIDIEKLSEQDDRVKLVRQKNKGLSGARNTGIREATGDYLFFIDGDDYLLEDKLSDLLDFIIQEKSDLVLFGAQGFVESDNAYTPFFEAAQLPEHKALRGTDALKYLLEKDYTYGWCVWHIAYKKELLMVTDSVFPEGKVSEDVAFMLKLWLSADSVSSYEDYVYAYRRDNAGSITHSAKFAFVDNLADNMISNIERLESISDEELKTFVKLNYQTLIEVVLFWYSAYSTDERRTLKEKYEKLKLIYNIPRNYRTLYRRKEKIVYFGLKLLGFDLIGKLWGLKRKRQS